MQNKKTKNKKIKELKKIDRLEICFINNKQKDQMTNLNLQLQKVYEKNTTKQKKYFNHSTLFKMFLEKTINKDYLKDYETFLNNIKENDVLFKEKLKKELTKKELKNMLRLKGVNV